MLDSNHDFLKTPIFEKNTKNVGSCRGGPISVFGDVISVKLIVKDK